MDFNKEMRWKVKIERIFFPFFCLNKTTNNPSREYFIFVHILLTQQLKYLLITSMRIAKLEVCNQ